MLIEVDIGLSKYIIIFPSLSSLGETTRCTLYTLDSSSSNLNWSPGRMENIWVGVKNPELDMGSWRKKL